MSDESKQWWLTVLEKFGLPSAILIVLLIMLWRAGIYVATSVVDPLVKAHTAYLEASTSMLKQIQDNGREALIRIEKNTDEILTEVKK